MVGELARNSFKYEILSLPIQLELNIVVLGLVDVLVLMKVFMKKLTSFFGCAYGSFEIGHRRDLESVRRRDQKFFAKEEGGEEFEGLILLIDAQLTPTIC